MSRVITISTEVFAAIWAARKPGEESEEDVLRRVLELQPSGQAVATSTSSADAPSGVHDARNGVHFPEGFEIFRTYKRREHSAHARSGAWVRSDNGERYVTLNQLNASIAAGNENVWNGNWKFRGPDGRAHSIAELRR